MDVFGKPVNNILISEILSFSLLLLSLIVNNLWMICNQWQDLRNVHNWGFSQFSCWDIPLMIRREINYILLWLRVSRMVSVCRSITTSVLGSAVSDQVSTVRIGGKLGGNYVYPFPNHNIFLTTHSVTSGFRSLTRYKTVNVRDILVIKEDRTRRTKNFTPSPRHGRDSGVSET